MNILAKAAVAALALTAATAASANVMTFANLQDYQNYSEDGINGTSNSWWNWPNSAEAHFDDGSATFTMSGLFDAISFDKVAAGGSGTVVFEGFLNGGLVASQTFQASGSHSFAGFTGIDLLRLSYAGDNHFTVDNLVLNEVPEPAMLGLFGLGALGLGLARRRKAA